VEWEEQPTRVLKRGPTELKIFQGEKGGEAERRDTVKQRKFE